jgi:hypothetical protein
MQQTRQQVLRCGTLGVQEQEQCTALCRVQRVWRMLLRWGLWWLVLGLGLGQCSSQ